MQRKSDLTPAYRKVYEDMIKYLSVKPINARIRKQLFHDLLDRALKNQAQGITPEEAFGDYRGYCDEIVDHTLKETPFERIATILAVITFLFSLYALFSLKGFDDTMRSHIADSHFYIYKEDSSFTFIISAILPLLLIRMTNRYAFHIQDYTWFILIPAYVVLSLAFEYLIKLIFPALVIIPVWLVVASILLFIVFFGISRYLCYRNYRHYLEKPPLD